MGWSPFSGHAGFFNTKLALDAGIRSLAGSDAGGGQRSRARRCHDGSPGGGRNIDAGGGHRFVDAGTVAVGTVDFLHGRGCQLRRRPVDDHAAGGHADNALAIGASRIERSEEHTSALPTLMRLCYAVFCLKTTNKYLQIIPLTS